MPQAAPRMKELHEVRRDEAASATPFSGQDLADIADCFERRTGYSAWVGYGFADANAGSRSTIYLFSAGAEGGRLTLRQTGAGLYELRRLDGALLWSGSRLKDFLSGIRLAA